MCVCPRAFFLRPIIEKKQKQKQKNKEVEDLLPDKADARKLKERAVMRFLLKEISALSDLKDLVPSESPLHPVQKTEVIPMCVLSKDEKYTSETVDILAQLMIDSNLYAVYPQCMGSI